MEEDSPDSPRSVIQTPLANIREARVYRTWDSARGPRLIETLAWFATYLLNALQFWRWAMVLRRRLIHTSPYGRGPRVTTVHAWRQASFGFQAVRHFVHDLFMEIELQFAVRRIGGVSGNLVGFGKILVVLGVLKERDGFIVGYGWFVEAARHLFHRR